VANLIRQGKLDQLENAMQSGASFGMKLMDSAIQELLDKAIINGKEAYKKAINKSKFEAVKGIG
jgi:twitching motility protein PilT